jgi:hypothetical protein
MHAKTWKSSQQYELESTLCFMNTDGFHQTMDRFKSHSGTRERVLLSSIYDTTFFEGDNAKWREFADFIVGKTVLEIGPSVLGIVCSWWWTKKRIVVDPLINQIIRYEKELFGFTPYSDVVCYDQPAERVIPELVNNIDGAIICRNMIDHTPAWAFVLSAIAAYAAPGARLLLWSDLYHRAGTDAGHYDITNDVAAFQLLIENLGFIINSQFSDQTRDTVNYGCIASKLPVIAR